jgi:hypothetical protein
MSAGESEASSKGSQIGKEEQQEQTTRSGLAEKEEEAHLGRKDRKDRVDHAASLVVDRAASLADQAATMTMTMMTAVADQVGRVVGSSDHKALIQKEPTRHRKQHEMRSPTLRGDTGDSTETHVRVHLQQLLRSGEEFLNL